nr:NADH dehydrogenase subunit 2 [Harengula humeralis]
MSPNVLTAVVLGLLLGTTLTLNTSHWLMAWVGLEINTLAIIPLMAEKHHPRAVEAATKYFLVQAAGAATVLFASTVNAWACGQWEITHLSHPVASAVVLMALALKIGLAPVHFWLPEVLQGVTLTTGLILSTWQKLGPLVLIMQISRDVHPHLLTALAICSTLVGGWGGLNQTQLRKVLAYSSIAHLGWMILAVQMAPRLAFLALVTYIIMTAAAFLTLNSINATKVSTLAAVSTKSPALGAMACLVLLSLGGLPPLTGFMPKWLILQQVTAQGYTIIATFVALSALISLYFYLRLAYAMALTLIPTTTNASAPWRVKTKKFTLPLSLTIVLATCLLPFTPSFLGLVA